MPPLYEGPRSASPGVEREQRAPQAVGDRRAISHSRCYHSGSNPLPLAPWDTHVHTPHTYKSSILIWTLITVLTCGPC